MRGNYMCMENYLTTLIIVFGRFSVFSIALLWSGVFIQRAKQSFARYCLIERMIFEYSSTQQPQKIWCYVASPKTFRDEQLIALPFP